MPFLKQLDERGQTRQGWPLGRSPVVLGRGDGVDAWIDDSSLSREHFVVEWEDGAHRITDKGSTNGTLVNGKKITSQVLKDGDKVKAGHLSFSYEFGVSTLLNDAESKQGRSLQSEIKDLYDRLDD